MTAARSVHREARWSVTWPVNDDWEGACWIMTAREKWLLTAKAMGVGMLLLTSMAALFLPIQQALMKLPI